jgi:hypothetical protein
MTVSVDANSSFISPPRIDLTTFQAVLVEAGSPWADQAPAIYDLIVSEGHDPAVWLAIAGREHSFGTNRDSVLWRNDTRSWTNARTVRHPGLSYEIIRDSKRDSNYVRYRSVLDSVRDGMYRVTDPTYRYVREGRDTIGEVLGIWTEDDAIPYTQYVVDKVNGWMKEQPVAGEIPGVPFIPADDQHMTEGRRDPWPTQIILHHTDGTDSLSWLTTNPNSDVSATYLLHHNGTIRAQLVRHKDTPHTTGYKNDDSLSIEWERKWPQQSVISDAQYAEIGWSVAQIYQAERLRGNPFFAGPMTRNHLADHNDFYNTTCPGNLDANRVFLRAQGPVSSPVPEKWYLHLGGGKLAEFPFELGFRDYVMAQAMCRYPQDPNSAALAMIGEPKEAEWIGEDGHTYQRCKRGTLHYTPGNAVPWDIIIEPSGARLPRPK